jgi:WD40 repeat protein
MVLIGLSPALYFIIVTCFWDAPLPGFSRHGPLMEQFECVAFSPDGKILATGSYCDAERLAGNPWSSAVKLWDARTGEPRATLPGKFRNVSGVAFSPDGKLLAAGGWIGHPERRKARANPEAAVRVWGLATYRELFTLHNHHWGAQMVFSPDNRLLATVDNRGTVRLWDTGTGERKKIYLGMCRACTVAFRPDSQQFATAGGIEGQMGSAPVGEINIWDSVTGTLIQTFRGHTADAESVAYRPGGRELVSASKDGTVIIWDLARGKKLRTFTVHLEDSGWMMLSLDGWRLAHVYADRKQSPVGRSTQVRVWDLATEEKLLTLRAHTPFLSDVAFSPNGRALAAVSQGTPQTNSKVLDCGELTVWPLP